MNRFTPKPGQIDFTNAEVVPVVNCLVVYEDNLLLVKRSDTLGFYPGYWHCIAGFMDDEKNAIEKAREELYEETGITDNNIIRIALAKKVKEGDMQYKRTWVVHFILVELNTNVIHLDWEATEYQWVVPKKLPYIEPMIPSFRSNALKILSHGA